MTLPPPWKPAQNRHLQILSAASQGRYGVLAAIAYNAEHIAGLVAAAQKAHSPLIIQFFPWAVTFADGLLVRAAAAAVSRCDVPISIHLDHAQDEALIRHAANTLPFDSIHERGIATEAEPGRIEGGEDGVMDTEGLEGSKTTIEEAGDFVRTGVDCLAPAIGNIHGEYGEAGPQLDFGRLEQIRRELGGNVRIALHGTNGFEPNLMRKCIEAGVSKINVNKLVLDGYYAHLEKHVGKMPHTNLIEEGTDQVIVQTMEWMNICGSTNKA